MTSIYLTETALSNIDEIERYSVETWGESVATRYPTDLEEAIARLGEDLSLFKSRHDYEGQLRFYQVREHVIVGDVIDGTGFILTVWHGSMDFIDRLPRLEPQLVREAELMVKQIEERDQRS